MRNLTHSILNLSRLAGNNTNFVSRRWTTSDFYNRYFYPPPTVLYHPADIGEARVMEREALEPAMLDLSGLPSRDLFAVIFIQGKQHKITVDDFILVNQIPQVEVHSIIQLDKVLLIGSPNWSLVGRPLIPRGLAKVTAQVLEHRNIDPVIVFKMKKRKNYKKTNIHRQNVTLFRIEDILVDTSFVVDDEPAVHPEDSIQYL